MHIIVLSVAGQMGTGIMLMRARVRTLRTQAQKQAGMEAAWNPSTCDAEMGLPGPAG